METIFVLASRDDQEFFKKITAECLEKNELAVFLNFFDSLAKVPRKKLRFYKRFEYELIEDERYEDFDTVEHILLPFADACITFPVQKSLKIELPLDRCTTICPKRSNGTTLCQGYSSSLDQWIVVKTFDKEKNSLRNIKMEINMHSKFMGPENVHPHILLCYDMTECERYVSLFLPKMEMDLASWLKKFRSTVSDGQKKCMMKQIVEACLFMKQKDMFHRDLKPGNILVDKQDNIKIADFGLACIGYDRKHTIYCGTPNYMAPEMTRKFPYTFAVDIWALGCIFFVFYAENPPFCCSNVDDLFLNIRTMRDFKFPRKMPSDLQILVARMLEKSPQNRPTLEEVLLVLE
jgi:serine/threonine protein kinase